MPRRGENIYKRKDGRWEGRYLYAYNIDGKAQYKYVYAKSYSQVKEKMISLQSINPLLNTMTQNKDKQNYDYWLNEWLQYKKLSVKDSSYIRYKNLIENHILKQLGKYPISKISTDLLKQYISNELNNGRKDKSGGLSEKTMTDILIIIKESLRYAQSCGINIICSFDNISIKKASHEMRVLNNLEFERLTSVICNNTDRYKLGVFICLYTGIRIGELCALQCKDISLEDKTLRIDKTMQRLQYENKDLTVKTRVVVTAPKSYSAIRVIPLPDFAIDVIKPFICNSNSFILSGSSKKIVEPRIMQYKFKSYLKEANIEDANFHSLRHTFATRCIEIGFDVKTLSEILGHSSVKITLDKYVHSSLDLKRSNMDKLKLLIS